MGLSRDIIRIELSTRTADQDRPGDRVALPGMPVWEVTWTKVDRRGREQTSSIVNVTEASARRVVVNLLTQRRPGLTAEDVFTDRT